MILLVVLGGCENRSAITFTLRVPPVPDLNPISDRVSDYVLRRMDGTVVAVASQNAHSPQLLPLGDLAPVSGTIDLSLQVLSGTELLGMARVRKVAIRAGAARTYFADVRKPLIFIGSALPDETAAGNMTLPGETIDPTSGIDLAQAKADGSPAPLPLPQGTRATAVTSNGLFLLAGRPQALTLVDTGTGMAVGDAALPFSPGAVVDGPADAAVAVLDRDGSQIVLFADVAALTGHPAAATSSSFMLPPGDKARAAVFSADGTRLYVLTGDPSADPCAAASPPPANSILVFGLDGIVQSTWQLPDFASALAVDPQSGTLILSQSVAGQVSTLAPNAPGGAVTPNRLFPAVCPSALATSGGRVFAVTSEADPSAPNAFFLKYADLAGSASPATLSLTGPSYRHSLSTVSTPDGNTGSTLQLRPSSLYAYAIAVTPDGSRAVFASRARYREANRSFTLLQLPCTLNVDAVEYGLYSVDLSSGDASYQSRATLVTTPASGDSCAVCDDGTVEVDIACPSTPGDRAAGVAALFGGP